MPPNVNSTTNPRQNNIGASKLIEPLYSVAVQLNTLIADGTATRKLNPEKMTAAYDEMPATNIWCAHTKKPIQAIPKLANATNVYPNSRLREKHGITSLTTPMPGRIMM